MTRRLLTGVLCILNLTQGVAHADLSDLPDPTADAGNIGATTHLPPISSSTDNQSTPPASNTNASTMPTPKPTSTAPVGFASSLQIISMSRKSGGTVYKVKLEQSLSLVKVELLILKNRLKIHKGTLVTDSGQRIEISKFRNSDVVNTGAVASSESLNQSDRISSIEIVAESYGGEADISVKIVADREIPKLTLTKEVTTETAPDSTQTTLPPRPPAPPRPPQPPAPATNNSSDIRVGDRVYFAGRVGNIARISGNQVVIRSYGYYDSTASISEVSKSVRCDQKGEICAGDRALYSQRSGVAKEIFANGKVLFSSSGYYDTFANASEVSKALQCATSKNICVNDRVYYSNTVGSVREVYANNQALLRRNGYYDSIVNANDLSKSVRCETKYGICQNSKLGYFGNIIVVKEVFENGLVLISQTGNYDRFVNASELR